MRILIPGGTGLLGNFLIPELIARKHQVWVLSRHPNQSHAPAGTQLVGWDGKTPKGWERLVEEVDAIINLAGENIGASRWTQERKARIRDSRKNAGKAIVEAIRQAAHKPAVLIQASGIGAYGPSDDRILDETAPYGNDFLSSVTRDWEGSTQLVEEIGVRRIVIRAGLVMTRKGGWMAPLLLTYRFFIGGPLGNGRQWWPWIHIQDYIHSVIFLLENEACSGIFNLAGPNPCQMIDFGKELARIIRRPYWFPAPAFGLRLLLGEMSTLVLDGQKAIPRKLLDQGYCFHFPDLHSALVDLFSKE